MKTVYRMMRAVVAIPTATLLAVGALAGAEAQKRGATNRTEALKLLCQELKLGPGSVIADVGCGDGPDTLVFAGIVGEQGTVLAQEIDLNKVKKVMEAAGQRKLHQVVPILGQSDDPRLPDGFADMLYMNRVFHHFAQPQVMLNRMWSDLKPGGFLVIIDQKKGPLEDRVAVESREKEHHWTGETAVVRLAREAGFLFHNVMDERWYDKQPFVLVFRKPANGAPAGRDPAAGVPPDAARLLRALPSHALTNSQIAFCGLDAGRPVLTKLREAVPQTASVFDIILNEWALTGDELPPGAPVAGVQMLRTEKAGLSLPENTSLGLVLFVDSYHRLWEPAIVLEQLRARTAANGLLAIADRQGPDGEPRRLAGHRRRISPKLVIEELRQAGFELRKKLSAPGKDRFFLLFGPASRAG